MKTDKTKITLNSVLQRKSEEYLISSEVGDELVMMDLNSGNYISINRMGTIIWNFIGDPIRVEHLVDSLIRKFDVSQEKCIKDTLECLNAMHEQKIIELKTTDE